MKRFFIMFAAAATALLLVSCNHDGQIPDPDIADGEVTITERIDSGDGPYVIVIPTNDEPGILYDVDSVIEDGASILITNQNSADPYTGTITVDVENPLSAGVTVIIDLPGAVVVVKGKVTGIDVVQVAHLIIDTPRSSVTFTGSADNVIATTAEDTLIVAGNSRIGKLTLIKGNLEVYGDVGEIVRANGYAGTVTWYATDMESFATAVSKADVVGIADTTLDLGDTAYELATPVVIRGQSAASAINGSITASANLTLERLTVSGTLNPIIATTGTAVLKATGVTINQNTAGTADTPADAPAAITAASSVELYDCTVNLLGTKYVRGINASGNVLLDNTTMLTGGATDDSNATYSRGVNVLDTPDLEIVIRNGSYLKGFYYALNVTGAPTGLKVTIDDSQLDSYGAINVWSTGGIYNITGSTLTGRNLYAAGSSDFAVIVNNSGATGNTYNVTDSELRNVMSGTALQFMVSLRDGNNTVVFNGATILNDSSATLNYMSQDNSQTIADANTVTAADTVTLIGKDGVVLRGIKGQ